MELARKLVRLFALPDHIKAAAVNHPELRPAASRARGFFFFSQTRIQPGEVKGRADPHDSGKHVYPASNQTEPFVECWIDVHFWRAPAKRSDDGAFSCVVGKSRAVSRYACRRTPN